MAVLNLWPTVKKAAKAPVVRFLWHVRKSDDATAKWKEDDHQSLIVLKLREWQQLEPGLFLFHADQGGIRVKPRTAARAKALGLEQGVPDLHFMLPRGRTIYIELKRWGGTLQATQKARIALMRDLGHTVHVVKERTPADAWATVRGIVTGALANRPETR